MKTITTSEVKTHILLPTDFSDNSWIASIYALHLYQDQFCTFYFLHSTKMKASAMSNFSNKLFRIMTINARKELLKLKELAESTNANSNHDFEVILSTDELTDAIEFAVKKHKINMVVMGTKGSTAAKELFFGSNTVKVIQRMRLCPVLIVPTDIDFIVPKQIAFPTDFSRYYGNKELDPLKNISALYNSKIRIVHINVETHFDEVQEYNLKMLKEYLKNCEHSFHWIPDYSKRVVEIKDFIDAYGINMLVMVNYKHSFIESIVNEPVIKKIGFGPTVPFLVIPD